MFDPSSVDENRARSALAAIATLLRPGEMQALAHRVEQRGNRELVVVGDALFAHREPSEPKLSRRSRLYKRVKKRWRCLQGRGPAGSTGPRRQ
jgi:hypothetical protein